MYRFDRRRTAGHVIPNIAVVEGLKDRYPISSFYISGRKRPEKDLIENPVFLSSPCSAENCAGIFHLPILRIYSVCFWHFAGQKNFKKFRPDKVFGKGGRQRPGCDRLFRQNS